LTIKLFLVCTKNNENQWSIHINVIRITLGQSIIFQAHLQANDKKKIIKNINLYLILINIFIEFVS